MKYNGFLSCLFSRTINFKILGYETRVNHDVYIFKTFVVLSLSAAIVLFKFYNFMKELSFFTHATAYMWFSVGHFCLRHRSFLSQHGPFLPQRGPFFTEKTHTNYLLIFVRFTNFFKDMSKMRRYLQGEGYLVSVVTHSPFGVLSRKWSSKHTTHPTPGPPSTYTENLVYLLDFMSKYRHPPHFHSYFHKFHKI